MKKGDPRTLSRGGKGELRRREAEPFAGEKEGKGTSNPYFVGKRGE